MSTTFHKFWTNRMKVFPYSSVGWIVTVKFDVEGGSDEFFFHRKKEGEEIKETEWKSLSVKGKLKWSSSVLSNEAQESPPKKRDQGKATHEREPEEPSSPRFSTKEKKQEES
jgi:hypothetical protein